VLLWAALPPLDLWPLAWFGPVSWVLLARRKNLPGRHPYRALWTVGFGFWLAALHWLRLPHWATSFGWLAMSFYFAFYLPLFVWLTRVAVHQMRVPVMLAAPIIYTGLELARAYVLTGFTMASIAHTQCPWLDLIQISDLAGFYAVVFVIVFSAACMARMLPCDGRRACVWPLAPLVAVLGAVLLYGHLRRAAAPESEPAARIALIQGSIDVQFKADPTMADRIQEHYRGLTLDAVREAAENGRRVDLVVWPETMFRNPIIEYPASLATRINPDLREISQETRREIAALVRQSQSSLLLGIDTHEVIGKKLTHHNSAAFVPRVFDPEAGANPARYDKIHLVMFGEYVPFAEQLPWLQRLTPLRENQTPGEMPAAFDLQTPQGGSLRIAPNICYESVLPQEIRWQVNRLTAEGREPDVLVNITNDGWFWGSSELDMHLACGVFRAIECRKPFLIAANTGFSAWIDADGCIRQQGPRRAPGFILADVSRDGRKSLYLTCGDWPAGICLAACMLLAAAGFWKLRRENAAR
jgi:apolipoprotein N-acyltransferase